MRRILCLLVPLLLCACSVKEDRSACPCKLVVRPAEGLGTEGSVVVSMVQDGIVVGQELLGSEDFIDGCCEIVVSRRPTQVTVFAGITTMSLKQGRILDIRSDNQCDELFSCKGTAELNGDRVEYTVKLHKNFARLNLKVLNLAEGTDLRVRGTVNGYDLLYCDPREGLFGCSAPGAGPEAEYCIRIPRQLDYDLTLDVLQDGETLRELPLGLIIKESGYSFADEDLKDIEITVDMNKSYAFISVEGWEEDAFPVNF